MDQNGCQTLSIPAFITEKYFDKRFDEEMDYAYFLGIELLDVYKGSKWADACISEIRNAKEQ